MILNFAFQNNGARVDVKDNHGVMLCTLGSYYPKMAARFSAAMARQADAEQEQAMSKGLLGVCVVCDTSDAKRCTG